MESLRNWSGWWKSFTRTFVVLWLTTMRPQTFSQCWRMWNRIAACRDSLFLLFIGWVMPQTVAGERTEIRREFPALLENLDSADDITHLWSTLNHLQSKTNRLEVSAVRVGLRLKGGKCKTLRTNSERENNVTAGNWEIEDADTFTAHRRQGYQRWQKHIEREEQHFPVHPPGGSTAYDRQETSAGRPNTLSSRA